MDSRRRSPLRILAPLAIVAFALALILVLSGGSGGTSGTKADNVQKARDLGPTVKPGSGSSGGTTTASSGGSLPQSVYVVKDGDTLGGIAQVTGVPVNKLQDLNPGLDQFSLVAGQRIKLR